MAERKTIKNIHTATQNFPKVWENKVVVRKRYSILALKFTT